MIVESTHCLLRFKNPVPMSMLVVRGLQYYMIRRRDGVLVRLRGQKLRYGLRDEVLVRTRSGRLRDLVIALNRARMGQLLRDAKLKVILVSLDAWKQCNWYMTEEEMAYLKELGIVVRYGCRWPSQREWNKLDRDWEMGKVRSRWLPPLDNIELEAEPSRLVGEARR